jgi:outer membrane protein OmpA-like peptidoglycan-associated protein
MLTLTLSTLLLATSPSQPAVAQAAQVTTIAQETFDEETRFPDAGVFFVPKSSVLSPLAADVVARAARHAGPEAVVLVRASSDLAAGETTQTAEERADAVRLELIRNGVPNSAIRIMHAGASRPGIESRRVIISVISAAPSSPRVAKVGAVPGVAL